jgi:1,4-alpha-glucan branching enzyme
MGGELAQEREWDVTSSVDWHLLESAEHVGVQTLVRDLNRVYREQPALWELDNSGEGFSWIEPNDADANVVAFERVTADREGLLVCVCNFSPVPRGSYRLGLPRAGGWREAVNTDSRFYGGSDLGSLGAIEAEPIPWHNQPFSAELTIPPLATVWLVPAD